MSDRYPLRTHIQVRGHYCYHTGRSDKTSYVCLYLCTQRKYTVFFSFIQTQSIRGCFYLLKFEPTQPAIFLPRQSKPFVGCVPSGAKVRKL